VVNAVSTAAWPLFLVGLFLQNGILMDLGIVLFVGAVVFQAITLPVEYNASKRAMAMLETSGMVSANEIAPVGNMLNAAALTYVAAMAVAIGQLLRLLVLRGNSRRR